MNRLQAEILTLYSQDAMETDEPWRRWEYEDNTGVWFCFQSDEHFFEILMDGDIPVCRVPQARRRHHQRPRVP